MHAITAVFSKEFRDARRDKRALMSAFLFPVFAPVFIYFMLTAVINLRSEALDVVIPISGAEHAPALIQWLTEHEVQIETFTGDAKQTIRDKDKEVILVIPDDYQDKLKNLKTIAIEIVNDGSRTDAQPTVARVKELIRRYNREISALRLIVRGVSPEVSQAVIGRDIDVASKQQRTARVLNFIPLYIILAAFVSGMGIAVDSTAGERERKTLEPLLINPVERYQIIMGKWFASTIFSSVGMILTLILCIAAMLQVPLDEIGLKFQINLVQISTMILATMPLAFLATSMQLLLGIFAKSFKDAQSYIGILTMLPVVPTLYMTFNPVATKDWMFAVPILGQHLLLVDVLGGKAVPTIAYFFSAISCLLLGMGLVLITARLFQRESILSN